MSKYIEFIRKQPCLVCGSTPCDPDHLEARGMGGAKSSYKDYSCVPLCREHHSERHRYGIFGMNERYRMIKLDLWRDAFNLIRRYFVKIP